MLKPLEIPSLTAEELEALENLYRTTKEVRLRTRAQIVPAFWRATNDCSSYCEDCARSEPNGPQLAQALDGRRNRRTQRSAHARASAQNQ
jgi:hypothetical protein